MTVELRPSSLTSKSVTTPEKSLAFDVAAPFETSAETKRPRSKKSKAEYVPPLPGVIAPSWLSNVTDAVRVPSCPIAAVVSINNPSVRFVKFVSVKSVPLS